MKPRLTPLASLALISACASHPDLQIPKEVIVQVPVPCVSPQARPQRPQLASDAELEALDDYKWAWALWGDRAARQTYQAELEAVVEGCSRIPVKP